MPHLTRKVKTFKSKVDISVKFECRVSLKRFHNHYLYEAIYSVRPLTLDRRNCVPIGVIQIP